MATVQSTLKMFDAMSKPLNNITQGMNMMISTMQKMQSVTDKNTNIDKQLAAAKNKISTAESEIRKAIEQSNNEQKKFNSSVQNGHKASEGLLKTVKGIAAAYLTIEGAKQLFGSTIGGAMDQQQMIDTFSARAGNDSLGKAIYDETSKQALKYGQDVTTALKGTMSFMSNTMDPKKLGELNKLAMRLSKLNPTEGLEGAAFSLKELMGGDYTSIAERFNISRSALKDSEARMAGMKGDVNGFIAGMDKLLNQQNLTEEAFEKMLDSPAAKWQAIVNQFKFNLAQAGQSGFQALAPTIERVNQAFQSGQMQPYFDMLAVGIQKVIEGLVWLFDKALAVYNFFATNWPQIAPIVYGLVGAFVALRTIMALTAIAQGVAAAATTIQTLATFVQTAATLGLATAWGALNTVMKANVIMLIVGLIIALVTWIINLWNTNDKFVAGFMRSWNKVLGFFDQIPIFFTRVGYGIANAFDNAKVLSLKLMEQLVNGVIDDLNKLISMLNKIPGVEIGAVGRVEFTASAAAEAEARRQARDANIAKMEQSATDKAAEREAKVVKMLDDRAAKRAREQAEKDSKKNASMNSFSGAGGSGNTLKNIDKVNKVGKIDDKVDISSEDLKMMRELAEMKSIQNFVTLQPKVQVTTGDINSGADLDTIMSRIEQTLMEDVASSAAGVYGNG